MPGKNTPPLLRRWQRVSFGLIVVGWLASGCMLLRMATIGSVDVGFQPPAWTVSACPGCDDALMSAGALVKGVPLPGAGLVYFATAAGLLAIGAVWSTRAALLLGAAGTGVSILLAADHAASAFAACLPCMLVHAANALLLVTLFADLSDQR